MNLLSKYFWLSVVILFITTYTQNINAKENKKIISVIEIDSPLLCGTEDDKNFVIAIDMGEVFREDSVYGFNFELRYDSTKIKITDYLVVGTLAENCSYKGCSFLNDTIRGYAANMDMTRLSGKKPLFAFKGKALTECSDSALIILEYVEFTEEFIHKNLEYQNLNLKIEKKLHPENRIEIKIPDDTLNLNEESNNIYNYTIPFEIYSSTAVKKLHILISGDNANSIFLLKDSIYSFGKAELLNTNDSLFLNITFDNQVYYKKFDINIALDISKLITEDKDYFKEYNLSIIKDNCKCIDTYISDKFAINYQKKEDSTYVFESNTDKNDTYVVSEKMYLNNLSGFKDLIIYNSIGQIVSKLNIENLNYVDLSNKIKDGIYFGILINPEKSIYSLNNSFIKKIKILKYSFIN